MACALPEIKDLFKTIHHLLTKDERYISHSAKLLNAPGENYGSLMLAVDILVEKNGKQREINTVAKLCPPNEWIKRMFATNITFKKEVKFYSEILPTLTQFQQEQNISENNTLDIFPECLGSRLNLSSKETVDEDAILLLENLKMKKFTSVDRMTGFNLAEAEVVLKDLALFHAVPLAYRIKYPENFDEKLVPHLNKVNIGQEMFDNCAPRIIESINQNLNLTGDKYKKFQIGMQKGFDFSKDFPPGNKKYATIVHRDFWVNNTMVLIENDKPIKSKLLDFQVLTIGSPISDLVFFLYTSIQQHVLQSYYEHLIGVYHNSFVETLANFNCDVNYYTVENFKTEIETYGPLEASHVLVMFKAIYADREAVKELSDFNLEEMFNDDGLTDTYKKRLQWTVAQFFERNWF